MSPGQWARNMLEDETPMDLILLMAIRELSEVNSVNRNNFKNKSATGKTCIKTYKRLNRSLHEKTARCTKTIKFMQRKSATREPYRT